MIQSNSYGGVQKLAETYFVLGSGSAILTDFGPKVFTLCIFLVTFEKRHFRSQEHQKRCPKTGFFYHLLNTELYAK